MAKISIIGAGSWGTALGLLLCNNGHDVTICSENEKEIESLKEHREHLTKLPGVKLPDEMKFTCDVRGSLSGQDILVMAKASPYVRTTCKKYAADIPDGQLIVNVAKGVEADTLMTMSQIIEEEVPGANVVVLSGPSHAEEVGRGLPTTIVVGAHDRESALYVQNVFMSPVFRVYTSPDITGIELGGALKKCHRTGSRNGGWSWLRRQYESGSDYPRDRGNCTARHGDGCPCGNLLRSFRYRRPDCNVCFRSQPEPESRIPDRPGQNDAAGDG